MRLERIWRDVAGEEILALGYATPLLRPWLAEARAILAMMPENQGAAYWPKEGPNVVCLANLLHLPLEEESVSRIIMLHALENMNDPEAFLREAWRVLKSGGRALIIVPNRRGLWAHADSTPFGTGRPYSARQLKALLREQGFYVERSYQALFWPPRHSRFSQMLMRAVEPLGRFLPFTCGGVHVVEVGKQLYSPTLVGAKRPRRRLVVPLSFPRPSTPVPTRRNSLETAV
jgi:SAM-dependent methyltransferase